MTQDEINKAFEGRWRIKGPSVDGLSAEAVKNVCRDFFEAAISIAEGSVCCGTTATYGEVCDTTCPFETFWNAYDKKVGKPKCEKLWHKLSIKERTDCLAYIPLYKQAQPDKQYRKNPETFLRNKSWNDELIYRNATYNKPSVQQQRIDKLADVLAGNSGET